MKVYRDNKISRRDFIIGGTSSLIFSFFPFKAVNASKNAQINSFYPGYSIFNCSKKDFKKTRYKSNIIYYEQIINIRKINWNEDILKDENYETGSILYNYTLTIVRLNSFKKKLGDIKVCEEIFAWVQHNIKNSTEPKDQNRIQHPLETLRTRQGDCEDKISLIYHSLRFLDFDEKKVFFVIGVQDFIGRKSEDHIILVIQIGDEYYVFNTVSGFHKINSKFDSKFKPEFGFRPKAHNPYLLFSKNLDNISIAQKDI